MGKSVVLQKNILDEAKKTEMVGGRPLGGLTVAEVGGFVYFVACG